MGVKFLAVHSSRGSVAVVGPVTGLAYHITSRGTPVSEYDVPDLLAMVADPCCGPNIPFDGKVRLFGITAGSRTQRANIPAGVLAAGPPMSKPKLEKPKKQTRKKPVGVKVEDSVVSVVEEPAEMFIVPKKLEDSSKLDKKD